MDDLVDTDVLGGRAVVVETDLGETDAAGVRIRRLGPQAVTVDGDLQARERAARVPDGLTGRRA